MIGRINLPGEGAEGKGDGIISIQSAELDIHVFFLIIRIQKISRKSKRQKSRKILAFIRLKIMMQVHNIKSNFCFVNHGAEILLD